MYLFYNSKIITSLVCSTYALISLTSQTVEAKLKPLEDEQLSEVTGQAYVSIDKNSYTASDDNISYLRINLGLDIETQLNAKTLELGRYERNDPRGEARDADVIIDNFSLGTIYDQSYYEKNPKVIMPLKSDGSRYKDGEIVPFKISNPFIEFALDKTTGNPIGVRIGLGEAEGHLSGIIKSLSGNVDVNIIDRGEGLKAASSETGNIFDKLVVLLAPYLTNGDPLQSKAVLLDKNGDSDPIRATMIGVPNGEKFVIKDTSFITRLAVGLLSPTLSSEVEIDGKDIIMTANDCAVIGINTCFSLEQFQSFAIGEVTEGGGGRNYLTGPETGTFLAFQSKNTKWLKDISVNNPDASHFIEATQGAFLNIPSGVNLNLKESLDGLPRTRTEYIDRGAGLF